jgi:hypothetical protein
MSLFHEFQHQFMVDLKPSMAQFQSDTPVAIPTFILNTDLLYCIQIATMLFRLILMLQVIVIAAPGKLGCS